MALHQVVIVIGFLAAVWFVALRKVKPAAPVSAGEVVGRFAFGYVIGILLSPVAIVVLFSIFSK